MLDLSCTSQFFPIHKEILEFLNPAHEVHKEGVKLGFLIISLGCNSKFFSDH